MHRPRPTVSALRPAVRTAAGRAAVALAVTLAAPQVAAAQPFTSLTFFGDSYFDTGNAFVLSGGTQPASPPYFPGRFSNGPVVTDYVAAALGRPGDAAPAIAAFPNLPASGNYAVGGATTTNAQGTATQLSLYLTRAGATPATLTDPTGLYTLFVGGNDIRDAADLADPAARQAAAVAAAQNVLLQANALAQAGATNVLLFTLSSPGLMPEAQAVPGLPAVRDQLTATFNSTLTAGLAGLQATLPGTTFFNFRFDNLVANILADARAGGPRYGITNTTAPCLAPFAPPGAPSCDVSVFADSIHPTTRVHEVFGGAVVRYVTTGQNVALVPEPSTIALVAGGVVALGAAAARRRRAA